MTPDTVRAMIRRACREAGSQTAFANKHGIKKAFLSQVLRGEREPGPTILDIFGLERSPLSYRKKDTSNG